MVANRTRSNSVISQAPECLCVKLGPLFEQGDWTSHCPSGMIRPALICCYMDTHTHTFRKRILITSSHEQPELCCSIDCQRNKTIQACSMKTQTQANINTQRSKAQSLLVINVHLLHTHHPRMLEHANSKENRGTQTDCGDPCKLYCTCTHIHTRAPAVD